MVVGSSPAAFYQLFTYGSSETGPVKHPNLWSTPPTSYKSQSYPHNKRVVLWTWSKSQINKLLLFPSKQTNNTIHKKCLIMWHKKAILADSFAKKGPACVISSGSKPKVVVLAATTKFACKVWIWLLHCRIRRKFFKVEPAQRLFCQYTPHVVVCTSIIHFMTWHLHEKKSKEENLCVSWF